MKKIILLFLLTITVYFNDNTMRVFDANSYSIKDYIISIHCNNFLGDVAIPIWNVKYIETIN